MSVLATRSRDRRPTCDLPRSCFDLHLCRPTSTVVLVQATGDLDSLTTTRLHELLVARLPAMAEAVVLDLSQLNFISVTGLELLLHAQHEADSRGVRLYLVDGPRCLERALIAARLTESFPRYATPEQALAEVADCVREVDVAV